MTKSWRFLVLLLLLGAGGQAWGEVLTLADCLRLAREGNPALQGAALEPEVAAEQVREARSGKLPRIDLDAGYTFQQDAQEVLIGDLSEPTQDRDYAHWRLSAEQTLYDFGRTDAQEKTARATSQASRFAFKETEQDVFLQTVAAYFRVLTLGQLLQAAREEVSQVEEHRRVAQALYDEGTVTHNDVLQAEVRLAASRQLEMAREGELENAWLRLNYLIGRQAEQRAELAAEKPFALDQAASAGEVESRPLLQGQRQVVTGAREQLAASRDAFWPELYARLSADYVENSHVQEQTIYAALVGFRVNRLRRVHQFLAPAAGPDLSPSRAAAS